MALGGDLGVGIVIEAKDLASEVVRGVARSFSGVGREVHEVAEKIAKDFGVSEHAIEASVGRISSSLGLLAAGLAGLSGSLMLANEAGKTELALKDIEFSSRVTGAELEKLEKQILSLGAAGVAGPIESAKALRALAVAGLSAKEAGDALSASLSLVNASMRRLSPDQAGGLVAKVLQAFPEYAGNAKGAADALARAMKLGGIEASELELAMKGATKGAGLLGGSLTDTIVALSAIKQSGGDVAGGAKALALAFKDLTNAGSKNPLSKYAEFLDQNTRKARPFLDVLADLSKNLRGVDEETKADVLRQAFGGQASAIGFLLKRISTEADKAGGDFSKAIKNMRASMEDSSVTAEGLADDFDKTWEGMKNSVGDVTETLKYAVGREFLALFKPVLAELVRGLTIVTQAFVSLPAGVKRAFAGFVVAASAAAAISGLVGTVALLIPLIGEGVLVAVGTALASFAQLLPVIIAVAAVGTALYKGWTTNFGGIRDVVLPILEKISLAARSLFALFSEGEITGQLEKDLSSSGNSGVLRFVEVVSEGVAVVEEVFSGFFSTIGQWFGGLSKQFGPAIHGLSETFGKLFGTLFRLADRFFRAVGLGSNESASGLVEVGSRIADLLIIPLNIAAGVVEVLAGTFEFLGDQANSVLEVVEGLLNFLSDELRVLSMGWDVFSNALLWPWTTMPRLAEAAFSAIESAFYGVLNSIGAAINALIVKVSGILKYSPGGGEIAKALEGAKLGTFGSEAAGAGVLAPTVGGSEAVGAAVPSPASPRGSEAAGAGPETGSAEGTTSGVPASAARTTTLPPSKPGRSFEEAAPAARPFEGAGGRSAPFEKPAPITINLDVDGRRLQTVQAGADRDRRHSGGAIAPWK